MDTHFWNHLFHIFIVGGFLLYVGIQRTNMPQFVYSILLVLGVLIILYHSYKVYIKLNNKQNPWINYIHIFIIAPVLIYIGLIKEKTPRLYFEIVLMLSFAAIGYHAYYLIN